METGSSDLAPGVEEYDEVPICLSCMEQVHPLAHYCKECGAPVGQLTPYIPYVSIQWEFTFWRNLWRKVRSPSESAILRVVGVILILGILLFGILWGGSSVGY